MGLISRAGDIFYALRFLRLLTKSWEEMDAFKYGIIDNNGKVLKKASTLKNPVEKSSYTIFHRLVFNLKRLLNKLPIGKTKLASYATALFLVKEHSGMTEEEMEEVEEETTVRFKFGRYKFGVDAEYFYEWEAARLQELNTNSPQALIEWIKDQLNLRGC